MTGTGTVESALRTRLDGGGRCLVPYVTGGLGGDWTSTIQAVAAAGADVIEVGIPFSDPVMDGPTIQAANDRALGTGATPPGILDSLRGLDVGVPLVVMTYYNIAYRMGLERFASTLADSGVSGCILPDLPLEETGPWAEAADACGVETILLAAPTTPDARLPLICERSRGFVYGVGVLGVTGVRSELASSACTIAGRLKAVTGRPVLVGVGVGTPEQAVEVSGRSDGVVVGSAVVQRMLDGAGPDGVAALVSGFREALDSEFQTAASHQGRISS
ncbi:MAG: tryptophan synthase subunit alpha [Acidimicrobiaceae bacterium]|nr:tryptophan synthase subunit alpha [Acidimicrobiaceae bacterium]MDP6481221.1 tryptophan synthase subunit alpha [Acidimicrobiales bacterium]MDP6697171.1 tryptophan synthase subunit alpha [Acidimicrobiales bacterium]